MGVRDRHDRRVSNIRRRGMGFRLSARRGQLHTRKSDLYEIRGFLDYGREEKVLSDLEEELVEALMDTAFLIGVKE